MKRILALLLIRTVLSGCGAAEAPESRDGITFTDSMDRTVTVSAPQRAGICSGSLAECWLLAGGEIAAVTRDAVTERKLDLPTDYIDLGSLKEPSTEAILAADLDFVILMSSLRKSTPALRRRCWIKVSSKRCSMWIFSTVITALN